MSAATRTRTRVRRRARTAIRAGRVPFFTPLLRTVPILDVALADLHNQLVVPQPERGGALLSAGGIITRFVEDLHGSRTGVSWTISTRLGETMARLEQDGWGTLAGTAHSHPPATPDPSLPDWHAAANQLTHNPHLDNVAVVIVTASSPDRPWHAPVGRGRMTVWLARRDGHGGVTRIAANPRILPLGRHAFAVADLLGLSIARLGTSGSILGVEHCLGELAHDDGRRFMIAVGPTYPLSPPLLSTDDTDPAPPLTWAPTDPEACLAAAVARLLPRRSSAATRPTDPTGGENGADEAGPLQTAGAQSRNGKEAAHV